MDIHVKHAIDEYLFTIVHNDYSCYIAQCQIKQVNTVVKYSAIESEKERITVNILYTIKYYDGAEVCTATRYDRELFDTPREAAEELLKEENQTFLPDEQ